MASAEEPRKGDKWPIKISEVFGSISNQIIHGKTGKTLFSSAFTLTGNKWCERGRPGGQRRRGAGAAAAGRFPEGIPGLLIAILDASTA